MNLNKFPIKTRQVDISAVMASVDAAQAMVENFSVAFEAGLVVGSTTLVPAITGMESGDVCVVADSRQGGTFKFFSGDMSANVTADPYGGLWIPPASDDTGASGAWLRMTEKDEFDSEWWLPDAMPAAAEDYLNAIFDILPSTARKLIMPRRTVTLTDTVILSAGIEYEGCGRNAPFDGGGGAFFPITIAASNAKLSNISSGNVTGTAVQGEPGGFHITDGLALKASDGTAIENVSARDCHAFNARTGFRVGIKTTPGEGGEGDPSIIVYGGRDTYLENFTCDGIGRIGIEVMRGHGVEVVGGVVRMVPDTFSDSGLKRGTRVVGCHNVTFLGTRFIGCADIEGNATIGVSIEPGGQDGGLFGGGSGSGAQDITCEGVTTENCHTHYRVSDLSANVTLSGCKGIGRTDGNALFLTVAAADDKPADNVTVNGCQSVNNSKFFQLSGTINGLHVTDNRHIGNNNSVQRFAELVGTVVDGYFRGNYHAAPNNTGGGVVRYASMPAETVITFDDNSFTPDSAGGIFSFTGDGTVKMKRRDSNELLPASVWAAVRPPLDQDVYV